MNIVLIGARGAGKTTVGKILARKLKRELAEMDELLVKKAGMKLPEIVERHGWEGFRDIEAELIVELAERDNIVNASGGGVVVREDNIKRLREKGIMVWLTASAETMARRIGDDHNRPLIKGKTRREDIEIALAEREHLYRKAADIIIDTDNKTPEEVAAAIIRLVIANAEDIINRLGKEETGHD